MIFAVKSKPDTMSSSSSSSAFASSASSSSAFASSASASSASASPAVAKQAKYFTPDNLTFVKSLLFTKHAETALLTAMTSSGVEVGDAHKLASECVSGLSGIVQYYQAPPPKPTGLKKLWETKEARENAKAQGKTIKEMWAEVKNDPVVTAELQTKQLKRKADFVSYFVTRGLAVPKLYKKKRSPLASLEEARIAFAIDVFRTKGITGSKKVAELFEKLTKEEREKYQQIAAAEKTDSESEDEEDGYSSASCMTPRGNPDSDEDEDEEDEDDEPQSKKSKHGKAASSSSSSSCSSHA